MSRESFELHPGRSLGYFALGSFLKDVLDHLKNNSHDAHTPTLDLAFSSTDPAVNPVVVALPDNGLRLRFDGPAQRLRLIEVVDFSKASITYNGHELFKSSDAIASTGGVVASGPTYRSLGKVFGPTYPGEYIPPRPAEGVSEGCYILSYPGVAFSFPVDAHRWSSEPNNVSSLLSSPSTMAKSMAIFEGRSWSECRNRLFELPTVPSKPRPSAPDSTELPTSITTVKVFGEGRIELVRPGGPSFWVTLSETTPQDLISELGPPDAIYLKNDRRLAIHKKDKAINQIGSSRVDESDEDNPALSADERELASVEHFYNYFRLGIDFLISQPTAASVASPTIPESQIIYSTQRSHFAKNHLTATKLLLHANTPGAWDFNRYRRCRWSLEHVPTAADPNPLTSETKFRDVSERLRDVFSSVYNSPMEARAQQRGMTLNRGWGASPDSSCELLGGWEEEMSQEVRANGNPFPDGVETTTELFGFPGLVFEVLKSGTVNCLTVY